MNIKMSSTQQVERELKKLNFVKYFLKLSSSKIIFKKMSVELHNGAPRRNL